MAITTTKTKTYLTTPTQCENLRFFSNTQILREINWTKTAKIKIRSLNNGLNDLKFDVYFNGT